MGSSESKYKEKERSSYTRKATAAPQQQQSCVFTHKKLIMTGPQNEGDITFSSFVQRNAALQKFERGFRITDFASKAPKHDKGSEFYDLRRITQDEKLKNLLWVDDRLATLNRYANVLPYRRNCVEIPEDQYGKKSYINASYVSSSLKDEKKSFIVCQSPLENTISDFWRMVLNEGTHTILMLCSFQSDDLIQSAVYFPDTKNVVLKEFPHVKIKARTIQANQQLTERRFLIETSEGQTREVAHFQWEGWSDHGVPAKAQVDTFLYLVKKIMERRKKYGGQPVVVHCSAGIGRSGTFVAVHNLVQILKQYRKNQETIEDEDKWRLSVFSVVRRLREQRWGMVQTREQYDLIYEIVKIVLENRSSVSF